MSGDVFYRLGGLASLAIGAGFGWFGIWRPLGLARAHAPEVSYDSKIFVLVPVALVFGLFFLVAGDKIPYRNAEKQTFTPAGWALMAAVAIAATAGFFLFRQQFEALGYVRA